MYSSRVESIDISGIRKVFEGAGRDAVNLGLGQPDFDTPEHIKRAAIDAIESGFTGYTANLGIPELREALALKFRRENHFEPGEVIVTSGASEALHLAMMAMVDRGDEVLVPDPGFVSYSALAKLAEGKCIGVPLRNLRMHPDDVLERVNKRTKMLIVNSPSNPTGAVNTRDEIRGFAEIAEDHNITILSDEVYEHFIYEGEHVSPAEFSDSVITVNAVSKTYSMTGWRIGYAAAGAEHIERMLKVHQYVQACANSIAQKAALAAVSGPQDCVAAMREEFRARRDMLMKSMGKAGIKCTRPGGAFYAFPEVGDDDRAASGLLRNGVITVPGRAFGENGKGHIRLSYAVSREKLARALGIIERVLGCAH